METSLTGIVTDLRDRGGLKGVDVANIAQFSQATVSRWTSGQALPHPKTQLLIAGLHYVVRRLAELYSPEETRVWLYSRQELLQGKRPVELIFEGDAEAVLDVIERLDSGAYL
jgi:uncharacterized protein (DUF2384 family)